MAQLSFLHLVAEIGELDFRDRVFVGDGIASVDICHATALAIVDDDIDKGERLSVFAVGDFALNDMLSCDEMCHK